MLLINTTKSIGTSQTMFEIILKANTNHTEHLHRNITYKNVTNDKINNATYKKQKNKQHKVLSL